MLEESGKFGFRGLALRGEADRLVASRPGDGVAVAVGLGDVGAVVQLNESNNAKSAAFADDVIGNLAVEAGSDSPAGFRGKRPSSVRNAAKDTCGKT